MLDVVDSQGAEAPLPLDGLNHAPKEGHVPSCVGLQLHVR